MLRKQSKQPRTSGQAIAPPNTTTTLARFGTVNRCFANLPFPTEILARIVATPQTVSTAMGVDRRSVKKTGFLQQRQRDQGHLDRKQNRR